MTEFDVINKNLLRAPNVVRVDNSLEIGSYIFAPSGVYSAQGQELLFGWNDVASLDGPPSTESGSLIVHLKGDRRIRLNMAVESAFLLKTAFLKIFRQRAQRTKQ